MSGILLTFETSHFEMSLAKDFARLNIPDISTTFDMSHFERSPLNTCRLENMRLISILLDTSQSQIGPCGPLEQRYTKGEVRRDLFEMTLRHAPMALLSSALDRGKNAGFVALHFFLGIDPNEPVNMPVLLAFERTQASPHSFRANRIAP